MAAPASHDESVPLLARKQSTFKELAGDDPSSRGTYDLTRLTTYRVFGVLTGTVLRDHVLWKETGVTQFIYFFIVAVLYAFRWENFSKFVGKEESLRAFIAMFSTLIGLLLSFYTSLNMARWWAMRVGVEEVCQGSSKLTILLTQVTDDEFALRAVHRYARASLFMIFAKSQEIEEHPVDLLVDRGTLFEDEGRQLKMLHPECVFARAQILWVWLTNLVTHLHVQKLTHGPPHYCSLLAAVEQGRGGLTQIQTYVSTPIPMVYVHLLGLMVKLHNVILVGLMALLSVKHSGGKDGTNHVALVRLCFRAFFMPFLYNAILVINTIVTDPFNGDIGDFSYKQFEDNIEGAAEAFIVAKDHLPDWMSGRKYGPVEYDQ